MDFDRLASALPTDDDDGGGPGWIGGARGSGFTGAGTRAPDRAEARRAQVVAAAHAMGRSRSAGRVHQQGRERHPDGAAEPVPGQDDRSGPAVGARRHRRQRQQDAAERAPGIGGAETGAGPVHWYEYYGAKNSRPWLIVDPGGRADSVADAGGPAARRRVRPRRQGRGEADSPDDRSLYDRCITRGRARLDDAGHLRQFVSDRAGSRDRSRSATR